MKLCGSSGLDPDFELGPPPPMTYLPMPTGPLDTIVTNTWSSRGGGAGGFLGDVFFVLEAPPTDNEGNTVARAGPQEPQRPKKEPVLIVEKEKSAYRACVWREWKIFNQHVERIEEAARQRFEANELPWWIEILKNMGPQPTVDERVKDAVPTIINYETMRKEINEGRQKAAEARDQAIKKSCKK